MKATHVASLAAVMLAVAACPPDSRGADVQLISSIPAVCMEGRATPTTLMILGDRVVPVARGPVSQDQQRTIAALADSLLGVPETQ